MFKRILKYLLTAIIVCYTLFAFVVIPLSRESGTCKGILVYVDDNGLDIMSRDDILDILDKEGLNPTGKNLDEFMCCDMENFISGISLIDDCQVYKSTKGYVVVNVDCRIPVIKIYDQENRTYHVDNEGNIIHGIHKVLYLPIASGYINDSIASNEVMEIAKFLGEEIFWNSQIEQIYFDKNGKMTMVPRVGNHIIEFGEARDIEKKFRKLYTFYKNGMNNIGWNKYSKINVEFSDKVICTKRDRHGKN